MSSRSASEHELGSSIEHETPMSGFTLLPSLFITIFRARASPPRPPGRIVVAPRVSLIVAPRRVVARRAHARVSVGIFVDTVIMTDPIARLFVVRVARARAFSARARD
jgi:hypothetical protein